MFEYADSGVTLATILETRKINKDGFHPVKVRVTYRRQRSYYSSGKMLSPGDWERLPNAKGKELKSARESIQKFSEKIKVEVKDLIKQDQFSFEALNKRLSIATSDTLNTAFTARIEGLKERGKISTSELYRYALRSLELFAGSNIKFQQVTVEWLRKYEAHLLKEEKSYTTISMHMRALQTIMNEAKEAGKTKVQQHPFGKGKYEIPQHEGRNMALTIAQVSMIVKHECLTDNERICRDLWLFSYLCNGANIADICKFKYSNIHRGEICFYRQKTLAKTKKKKLIQAIITPEMQSIMEEWGNQSKEKDAFIFPFLKGGESPIDERLIIKNLTRKINHKMKVLGEKLGIGSISTYTARHSYASVLKRSGANIAFISESLGHNDLKTTENYLASFEQEERVKNAALLTNF